MSTTSPDESEHGPDNDSVMFALEGDLFLGLGNDLSPHSNARDLAIAAWEQIEAWVHSGYKPVVTLTLLSGATVVVDTENGEEMFRA